MFSLFAAWSRRRRAVALAPERPLERLGFKGFARYLGPSLGLSLAALSWLACGGDLAPGAGVGAAGGAGGGAAGEGGAEPGPPEPTAVFASFEGCGASPSRFATGVVEIELGPGSGFGLDEYPEVILGPPEGGGAGAGSLDVLTLGQGGFVTLAFEGNGIVDGPGVDFVVFENAFFVGGDPEHPYAELARVEVSTDGVEWVAFPCEPSGYPFGSCAGWHPVYASSDEPSLDPTDPEVAGGDAFDLADVGLSLARYVRVVDLASHPTTFDLDAVAIVSPRCD